MGSPNRFQTFPQGAIRTKQAGLRAGDGGVGQLKEAWERSPTSLSSGSCFVGPRSLSFQAHWHWSLGAWVRAGQAL